MHGLLRWPVQLLAVLAATGCMSAGGSGTTAIAADEPIRPKPYLELKFAVTVGQQVDFSCGAATLATLSTYYWGTPLSEIQALAALLAPYSDEERKEKRETGFSFADMITAAGQLGLQAQGAKVAPQELAQVAGPLIVHLDKGTFQHFSVLRRAGHGTYYLSDPVAGAIAMPEGEFIKQYTGFALAVWRQGAPLPRQSALADIRDGTDVSLSVGRTLNPPAHAFAPSL